MARSGRILVVDDEVNARSALAELLTDEGFQVETAADAFKALGKFEAFLPHVVVTDLKMPGMDGGEIPSLAQCFLDRYAKANDKPIESFAPATLTVLSAYDWPATCASSRTRSSAPSC
jgi:DNA-binding NtrC family response regulator